jgi:hypothetical protein
LPFALMMFQCSLNHYYHYHHYHHQDLWRVRHSACSLSLKVKLILPSVPRSSNVSLPLSPTFQCLFVYPVCVHSLYVYSHSRWYCFISKTMFCTPSFSLTDWFIFLSNLVLDGEKSIIK